MAIAPSSDEAPKLSPRPLPVSIFAILVLTGALAALFIGSVTYSDRATFLSILQNETAIVGLPSLTMTDVSNFAFILIGYGMLHLAIAYGLWTGQNWARKVSILLSIIGLLTVLPAITFLPELALPVIIFAGLVIYYFTRPRVKEYFS